MVATASLLVASVFGEENWAEGYRWVRIQLKGDNEILSNHIKIDQAVNHIRRKEFDSVINLLKGFQKKECEVRAIAMTNISFLYFLERNLNLAEDYADIAVKTSQYNAKALVNKGN